LLFHLPSHCPSIIPWPMASCILLGIKSNTHRNLQLSRGGGRLAGSQPKINLVEEEVAGLVGEHMNSGNTPLLEKSRHKLEGPGLLFEYALKFLLLAGFLELILYRLVSRLGMHLSKLAEKSEAVRVTFKTLSSLGFVLLNLTSLLLFLVIFILLVQKLRQTIWTGTFDKLLVPALSLLVALTLVYLVFPPAMIGSVIYNVVTFAVLLILAAEYMVTNRLWTQRIAIGCFLLGISGWIYYQTLSTSYGLLGLTSAPPLVHEVVRSGEALLVLASILVFWAYGTTSLFTKNKDQRRWAIILLGSGGVAFFCLLFIDYLSIITLFHRF